jgi:hypothetical protein
MGRMVPPLEMVTRFAQSSLSANIRLPVRGPQPLLCASNKKTQALDINANTYVFLCTRIRVANTDRAENKKAAGALVCAAAMILWLYRINRRQTHSSLGQQITQ